MSNYVHQTVMHNKFNCPYWTTVLSYASRLVPMAESDVKKDDKEGGATLFECPMFQNYQARATFLSDFFPDIF